MPATIGSFLRHAAVAAFLLVVAVAPASAQPPLPNPPTTGQFMSRYDFHLAAAALSSDEANFKWDTHFGGDFDFVDYVYGRMIFTADYQALLGNEFRPFDPYQGNYTLEAAGSVRANGTEIVGALHHVSRHLGDRPKRFAVAWNEIDVRLLRQFQFGESTLDGRLEGGKVIARATVDYDWTAAAEGTFRRGITEHSSFFGHGYGQTIWVIDTPGRQTQWGGKLEAGIRFTGNGGALELMAGVERMIDADPVAQVPLSWAFAGFRLVTK
ncbi:MAG TPA: hypothetical protein VJP86_08925 [Vicinamibacterales bacterium]|jgi:hypothetical protein|nr:hypothetical protein [Vicinamibacterales bacterium]